MTYLYLCRDCAHTWEAEQRITDPALKACPECGSPDGARRQISGAPSFHEVHRRMWCGPPMKGRA